MSTNPYETGELFPPERQLRPFGHLPVQCLDSFEGVEINGISVYRCNTHKMLCRSSHWNGTTDLLDAFFIPDLVLHPSAVCHLGHDGIVFAGVPNGSFSDEHIPRLQDDPLEGQLFFCRFDTQRVAREWYWRKTTIDELTADVGGVGTWLRYADNLE